MERLFDNIPEPSTEVKRIVNDLFVHYLFYSKDKRYYYDCAGVRRCKQVINCTCSHCNTSFTVSEEELTTYPEGGIKHNCKVLCPKCLTETKAKHRSYGKGKLNEHCYILAFCPQSKNKVWLRGYYCYKCYHNYKSGEEDETPEIVYGEEYRYLLKPKQKARCWEMQYHYANNYRREWTEINPREPFPGGFYGATEYFFVRTPEEVSKTFLKYIDIETYYENAQDWYQSYSFSYYSRINPFTTRFICDFSQYPIIESLIKAGFGEIVAERIVGCAPHLRLFDWNADTLRGFFKKFNLSEAQKLKSTDYMVYELKNWVKYKKLIKNPQLGTMLSDSNFFSGPASYETFLELVRGKKLEYQKALKLIVRSKRKEIPCTTATKIYEDYLNFAERLGYQMDSDMIRYPKDLYKAHDDATRLINAMEREAQEQEMKKITEKNMKKYSFEYGDLCIVVPRSMDEIIKEGQKLSHCVGGYADLHAQGKTTILFIRHKEARSVSYVTMEVIGNRVIQVHGYKNDRYNPLSKEVTTFVEEFKKYIINPKAYNRNAKKARKSA